MAMPVGKKVLNTVVLILKQRNNIHGNVSGNKGLKHSHSHFRNNIHGYACGHKSLKHSRSHFKTT
jgi:hypothetical protein